MSDVKVTTGLPQPQAVGEDPLFQYTKLFVRFLQVVFATFEKGAYRWSEDMETTDVVISDQGMLRREVVDKRPLIVCMRGAASWLNVSMDQFLDYDLESGKRSHTDLISCSMTYNCLAREGLEAQRIAWIAAYATRTLKRHLLRAGLHRVGENVDMGAETDAGNILPDSGKDFYLVQVSVPFFFQDSYSVAPVDKLLLKDLHLTLTSEVNYPAPDGKPVIQDPAMGGRVLRYDKVISLTQRVSAGLGRTPKSPK